MESQQLVSEHINFVIQNGVKDYEPLSLVSSARNLVTGYNLWTVKSTNRESDRNLPNRLEDIWEYIFKMYACAICICIHI